MCANAAGSLIPFTLIEKHTLFLASVSDTVAVPDPCVSPLAGASPAPVRVAWSVTAPDDLAHTPGVAITASNPAASNGAINLFMADPPHTELRRARTAPPTLTY